MPDALLGVIIGGILYFVGGMLVLLLNHWLRAQEDKIKEARRERTKLIRQRREKALEKDREAKNLETANLQDANLEGALLPEGFKVPTGEEE